jgi:hypothetical protein
VNISPLEQPTPDESLPKRSSKHAAIPTCLQECIEAAAPFGKPARKLREAPALTVMTRQERVKAGDWLRGRMSFLSTDSEDSAPSMDWILEKAKDCVMRLGITDLLIDPINELEQARGNMSETEFIGRMLQRARSFALRHGCNVWIDAGRCVPA